MKHRLLHTLGLIVLVMVAFSASPANAQTTANGPYYATPAWDQTLACTTPANCPRFIVLSNMGSAAVLDRETGLVWEKSPSTGPVIWVDARMMCNNLTIGKRKGWRLPTIQELASLVDGDPANIGSPRLPPGHPFTNVQSSKYWAATQGVDTNDRSNVDFSTGEVGQQYLSSPFPLLDDIKPWCVRGGPGVESL